MQLFICLISNFQLQFFGKRSILYLTSKTIFSQVGCIDYDIKHGVTDEDVLSFIDKIRNDSSYSNLQDNHSSMEKLDEVRKYILASRNKKSQLDWNTDSLFAGFFIFEYISFGPLLKLPYYTPLKGKQWI